MNIWELLHGQRKTQPLYGEASDKIVGTHHVGIEIELEDVIVREFRDDFRQYWRVVEDNSLRSRTGMSAEYVIDGTVSGSDVYNALSIAYDYIHSSNISSRTAMHVHLNVSDLTLNQVKDLIVLFISVEDFFDAVGGGVRGYNNFSLSTKYSYGLLNLISELYSANDSDARRILSRGSLPDEYRYAGINLASIYTLGSLEFRNRCTPESLEDAVTWVNLILSLKEYVVQFEERIPFKELFQIMSGDVVRGMIKEVFSSPLVTGEVEKHLGSVNYYESMRRAQSVLASKELETIHKDILKKVGVI